MVQISLWTSSFLSHKKGYREFLFERHPYYVDVADLSVQSNRQNSFRTLALFPWNSGSLATLWKGRIASQDETAWKKLISDFSDAIIVGGDRRVYIFYLKASKQPTCINLPDVRYLSTIVHAFHLCT